MSSSTTIGEPIPSNELHAVTASLPTWDANLSWARKDSWLLNRMNSGYPRFFIHGLITQLSRRVVAKFGSSEEHALLLSSRSSAERCMSFLSHVSNGSKGLRTMELNLNPHLLADVNKGLEWAAIYPVFFSSEFLKAAKAFWQHTGEGISSRRAEYCHALFDRLQEYEKPEQSSGLMTRGVYHTEVQEHSASNVAPIDRSCFLVQADSEKYKLRRFIASLVSKASDSIPESDVFLYPSGMSAFWNLARAFQVHPSSDDSKIIVIYGFLYLDTVKVLSTIESREVVLYGHGNEADLDKLESKLAGGAQVQALYCEFPGNPLLKSPDLRRIRTMADKYDFVVVCDDTIGTAVNVNVIPYVDVLCTSLTKLFSGACNVMGGSLVLNQTSRYHDSIHAALSSIFVDTYFPPDAVLMEHNARDFVSRVLRVSISAESIADLLNAHRTVEHVYYPKNCSTRALYECCKRPGAGYGFLMTILFKQPSYARTFFDSLDVAKGPSLGTNFTLACPYALLAHYTELDWASGYGVVEHLVRISVGLEEVAMLLTTVTGALDAIELKE